MAIPIDSDQGLDSSVSGHFGHCKAFLISTVEDGKVVDFKTFVNLGHSTCAEPVVNLANQGVSTLIARGMGGRPFMVTQQVGMNVVRSEGNTAGEVLDNYLAGKFIPFGSDALCGGGGAHH